MSLRRLSLLAAVLLITATVVASAARAQTAPITDFTLKRADNSTIALSSLSGRKAVVVVFTNPGCAFSRVYQNRLDALSAAYSSQGVEFLLVEAPIRTMDQAAAGTDVSKVKIKSSGAEPAVLTDEGLKALGLLGVSKTNEAVVLQPVAGGFTIRYRGGIDDNPQMETNVKEAYLKNAIDAVLAGKTAPMAEKLASGCLIKKN
jgi:thiol-disulfide isomerase/thioredoxin